MCFDEFWNNMDTYIVAIMPESLVAGGYADSWSLGELGPLITIVELVKEDMLTLASWLKLEMLTPKRVRPVFDALERSVETREGERFQHKHQAMLELLSLPHGAQALSHISQPELLVLPLFSPGQRQVFLDSLTFRQLSHLVPSFFHSSALHAKHLQFLENASRQNLETVRLSEKVSRFDWSDVRNGTRQVFCSSAYPAVSFNKHLQASYPLRQLFIWVMARVPASSVPPTSVQGEEPSADVSDLWRQWNNYVPVVNFKHALSELHGLLG
jgi:hypothetical protein